VAAVAGVLVIVGGAIVGGMAGLIGSGAFLGGEETDVAATTAVAEPEPVAVVSTPAATTAVEPAEPTTPIEPEESGTPDTEAVSETEPAAEPPGTSTPEETSPTAPPEEASPTSTTPVSTVTTEPTAEEDEGTPWGTIEVQSSSVNITSDPAGAEVIMDGDPIGVTPLQKDVLYGPHAFELRLDGYETASRSVPVDSPELRLDGYETASRSVPVDSPETPVSFALAALARSGAVIVVLEGWDGATLYVDGEKAGVLPARIQVTEGSHDFKVESPSGTQSVTRDVVLSDGGVTIVNLSG
ncbi:MAG: PEGA domain-containing protein, partial [Deltaproteobacteria bacterium]|nr:PEGA domain-containing protein [Deltaproteobacteria bacterium]